MYSICYVKNVSGSSDTWRGQTIANNGTYQIPDGERVAWSVDSKVLVDIAAGDLQVGDGATYFTDIPTAIHWLIHFEHCAPNIDYSEIFYKKVSATSTDSSTGIIIPNGQTVAVKRFKGHGQNPDAYTCLAFDWGGDNEKIFGSFEEPPDEIVFDTSQSYSCVTGNGTDKLQIVIVNDNTSETAVIGGFFEALIV